MINYLLPSKAATVQTLGHPAAGVVGWLDSSSNASGVTVTENTALSIAAVWCATRVISETLATLPCILYRRKGDDERERATDDDRYGLVHDEPHPAMSAVTFFETQTAHMVLGGNCYAKIRRDNRTLPGRLELRIPNTVTPEVQDDSVRYRISEPPEEVGADDMLHVMGLGGDGLTGWSVVRYAAQSLGTGMASDQYAAGLYGNRATPAGIIKHPLKLNKEAREQYRREWNEIHGGSENAGKVAIMHGGIEFQPISMTPEDAQFLGSRNFSIREIARWFRLPPHMLADLENSSVRANIEQQAIEFIVYSMRPWLVRWQQALNRKLLAKDERQDLYFEFLLDALLSGDQQMRYQAYSIGRQWGWLSINDIRRKENMPLVDGGDEYLQPMNMDVVGEEDEEEALPPAPPMMPPQPPPGPEDEEEQDTEEDGEVPQSLKLEMSRNLCQSLGSIVDAAKTLRADLSIGRQQLEDSFADANALAQRNVAGLRELRNEIRRDIDNVGKTVQVRGWDTERKELVGACNDLLVSSLRYVNHFEKSEVLKAARKVPRGFNFIAWLDRFYAEQPAKTTAKISAPVACYRKLDPEAADDLGEYIGDKLAMEHKHGLLAACDGDADGLLDRVHDLFEQWDADIETTTFGE